jgi:hypothetical protein
VRAERAANPSPKRLRAEIAEAHRTADVVLFVERLFVDDIASELPHPVSLLQAMTHIQSFGTENLPNSTAFGAAMSKLAGEAC